MVRTYLCCDLTYLVYVEPSKDSKQGPCDTLFGNNSKSYVSSNIKLTQCTAAASNVVQVRVLHLCSKSGAQLKSLTTSLMLFLLKRL